MPSARAAVRALVAQLSAAQRALDAGDLQAARDAAEAALSADPGNAAAQQILDRVAAVGRSDPAAAPAPPASAAGRESLVDGAAWSTFEQRVRTRRADRCAARVREAHERDDADAARAALAELMELAPDDDRVASLTALLSAPSSELGTLSMGPDDDLDTSTVVAADVPDWSDTWLDAPRMTLELDVPDDSAPRQTSTILSLSQASRARGGSGRLSRTLAAAAVAACAIAAVGVAFWLVPGAFWIRSASELLSRVPAARSAENGRAPAEPSRGASGSVGDTRGAPGVASPATASGAGGQPPAQAPQRDATADEGAESVRADPVSPEPRAREQPASLTSSVPSQAGQIATAGGDSPAPARDASESLVEAERVPSASAGSPASSAGTVAPPVTTLPTPQEVTRSAPAERPPLPVVSGTGSLPGVSNPVPGVQPYVTPPVAASSAASSRDANVPPPRDDAALVRAAIEGYRRAYNSLDASAAAKVWPTVDAAALGRAFRQLRSQGVIFDRCAMDVGGELARVECEGRSEWVPAVGDSSLRTARRTWHFDLSRADRGWTIVRVNVTQ